MKNTLPQELQPAYKRPIDKESIDARMRAQIAFEDASGISGRTRVEGSISENSLAKKAATIATIGVVAAGSIFLIERASDYEKNQSQTPTHIEHQDANSSIN